MTDDTRAALDLASGGLPAALDSWCRHPTVANADTAVELLAAWAHLQRFSEHPAIWADLARAGITAPVYYRDGAECREGCWQVEE